MKKRLYDSLLGLVLGLCSMGLFAIWQADQIRRWERLYWEQDYEITTHKNYGTSRDRIICDLTNRLNEQKASIAKLSARLAQFEPEVTSTFSE